MTVPFLPETEAFLLGRMLSSINAANDAVFALSPGDFYDQKNRAIFEACSLAVKKNVEVEPMTILTILQEIRPGAADAGHLLGLKLSTFGDSEQTKSFIGDIKRVSMLRQIIELSKLSIEKAHSKGVDPEEVQAEMMGNLNQVFSSSLKKTSFKALESIENFEDSGIDIFQYAEKRMEEHHQGVKIMKGIPLDYERLDGLLKGICRGHFIIIGARPGVGKSTFVCNMIHRLLHRRRVNVGFFSMEMTRFQVAQKLICIAAQINSEKLDDGTLSHQEFLRFYEAGQGFKGQNLIIEEQDALPVSQFIARARRMIANDKIDVIFVDYLTRLRGEGKFNSKQEEVMMVSKALCAFAKEVNIPLVCIAQLNRDVEKNEKTRPPRKSDLSQSGQIEADAHSILMLHRPDQDDPHNKPGLLRIYVVKNRFGKEGYVDFSFDGATGIYEEITYRREDNGLDALPKNDPSENDPWEAFQ